MRDDIKVKIFASEGEYASTEFSVINKEIEKWTEKEERDWVSEQLEILDIKTNAINVVRDDENILICTAVVFYKFTMRNS